MSETLAKRRVCFMLLGLRQKDVFSLLLLMDGTCEEVPLGTTDMPSVPSCPCPDLANRTQSDLNLLMNSV